MYTPYNPSPIGARVGDCAVRALTKALDTDWDKAYLLLCAKGFKLCDMPNANSCIHAVLADNNFERAIIPNTCPYCYTIQDFSEDNPNGVYVVGTGTHVVAVVDGDIYDSWDSSNEIPMIFWRKKL